MTSTPSDSHYAAHASDAALIDVVDEEWEKDTLSDDDIVVNIDADGTSNGGEDDVEGCDPMELKAKKKTEETWNDLDLDSIK